MKATTVTNTTPHSSFTLLAETAELLGSALLNVVSACQTSTCKPANPLPWYAPYCHHHHAPMAEGLVNCPTCQQAVVRRWYVLRCSQCNHRRPATYASTWQRWLPWLLRGRPQGTLTLHGLRPTQPACEYCGHCHWYANPLAQFEAQHSAYAILAAEPAVAPKGVAWASVRCSQQTFTLKPFGELPPTKTSWPVWVSRPQHRASKRLEASNSEPFFVLSLWPK